MKRLNERKPLKSLASLFLIFMAGILMSSCDKTDSENELDKIALTASDSLSLVHMREEEKLARDVYLELYELYELTVFSNIASSEQTHMDEVLKLITNYGIADPASAERGVFVNKEIQKLYDDLMEIGRKSLNDALMVGATIEDVDIFDLDNFINAVSNQEIKEMYSLLKCGSRNHLRAFVNQLSMAGAEYNPVYISDAEYQSIINSSHETCGMDY